jgi:poly(3-hydroxybutyrate) depolymerase
MKMKRIVLGAWLVAGGLALHGQVREKAVSPVDALEQWLATPERGELTKQSFAATPLSGEDARRATDLILRHAQEEFVRAHGHEWREMKLVHGKREMRLVGRVVGERPADGRALYISMHGGGNTTANVNDGQWRNQVKLYNPEEGIYVAPRAAVDDWNMWFQPHVDTLFAKLVRLAVVMGEVNPDKVYLLGYSAGGDGVYRLAPRLADFWAAASMMAGHPGGVSPLSLRNIGFMIWMGERDGAYRRNEEARAFGARMDSLAQVDPGGYPHETHIVPGKGHWMDRLDTLAMPWMAAFKRNPLPKKVAWQQDEVTRDDFYWLSVEREEAQAGRALVVERDGNTFTISRSDYPGVTIRLNDAMVDFRKPVRVIRDGKVIFNKKVSRSIADIYRSVTLRGDTGLVFSAHVTVR